MKGREREREQTRGHDSGLAMVIGDSMGSDRTLRVQVYWMGPVGPVGRWLKAQETKGSTSHHVTQTKFSR